CSGGFVQLSSGATSYKIAIYNRDDPPKQFTDCLNDKFTVNSVTPINELQKNIGVVKTWGYYKGTVRSVESKIIE
ncbi:MAG: hypothetical protein WCG84_04635, partial [Candidatus Moraniibacteriota bacterium]